MTDFLSPLIDWLVGLMTVIGAPGAGLAVALENIFPPIPSEVVLPLAGVTAARGHFTVAEAILWTTAGSVIGALALYWMGVKFGADRLRAMAAKAPLQRLGDDDDLKGAVLLFASAAGKHITGQILAVDGGVSCYVPQ